VRCRERILKLYEQGKSTAEMPCSAGYCGGAVRRVRQHFQARGTVKPPTHLCGRKNLLTAQRKARLQKRWPTNTDATLAKWRARLDRPFRGRRGGFMLRRLG